MTEDKHIEVTYLQINNSIAALKCKIYGCYNLDTEAELALEIKNALSKIGSNARPVIITDIREMEGFDKEYKPEELKAELEMRANNPIRTEVILANDSYLNSESKKKLYIQLFRLIETEGFRGEFNIISLNQLPNNLETNESLWIEKTRELLSKALSKNPSIYIVAMCSDEAEAKKYLEIESQERAKYRK